MSVVASSERMQPPKRSGARRATWFLWTGTPLAALAGAFLAFVAPTLPETIAEQGDVCTGPLGWVLGTLVAYGCMALAVGVLLLGATLVVAGSVLLARTTSPRT